MRKSSIIASMLGGALLAACGGAPASPSAPSVQIAPQDFVVLPCGPLPADRLCALAVAGGKRVMFGAPAGAVRALSSDDLRLLDAVLIFSVRGRDIEGLDELRNESWRAGRSAPLLVIGPTGTEEVITALNKAFEQSDALRIVEEGIPPGGYDAAIMTARIGAPGQTVFNTGDVQVRAARHGYDMIYNDAALFQISSCDRTEPPTRPRADLQTHVRLGCEPDQADQVWPLTAPLIIVKNELP
ncbi:MAG: hypothetical protein AAFY82_04425 [Pseudomonadota bacterium]